MARTKDTSAKKAAKKDAKKPASTQFGAANKKFKDLIDGSQNSSPENLSPVDKLEKYTYSGKIQTRHQKLLKSESKGSSSNSHLPTFTGSTSQ